MTITAERAGELMHYVETLEGGKLVPMFALCLFAGIRPCVRFGEIVKLKPESVRLDTGVIRIEPEVSKVRMPRNVTIQPNLAAWLRAYHHYVRTSVQRYHHYAPSTRHSVGRIPYVPKKTLANIGTVRSED